MSWHVHMPTFSLKPELLKNTISKEKEKEEQATQ
jgi:hypothetical protein